MLHGTDRRGRWSSGFTLLELLLVLALLVAVVSLTMPMLSGPLENQRLRRAADQVRAGWARARVRAMESGRAYVFRFEPGANVYTLEPWISGDDYLESDQLLSLGVTAEGESLATASVGGTTPEKLPENTFFVATESSVDLRAQMLAASAVDPAAVTSTVSPIFFYPDGTTSTARVMLGNQRGRTVTLTMRGLTGVVYVSDLETRVE